MKRETLLTVAVFALLLLNLGTLAWITFHHPPHPLEARMGANMPGDPRPFDRMIVESLGLTAQQQSTFDTLKRQHHEAIIGLDRQYEESLRNYLMLLKANPNSSAKDSLEKSMAAIQVRKASITLDHFRQLRSIGTAEQQAKFDALIPRLTDVLTHPRMGPPPPMDGEHGPEDRSRPHDEHDGPPR